MADEELVYKVHQLGDLDLAALLCLINREHCIISTHPDALDDLVAELQLVASDAFGLTSAVVNCNSRTTLDDLAAALLVPQSGFNTPSHSNSPVLSRTAPFSGTDAQDSYFTSQKRPQHPSSGYRQPQHYQSDPPLRALSPIHPPSNSNHNNNVNHPLSPQSPISPTGTAASLRIANVILARDLDRAPKAVQIQCLELLRTRRIFTRTSVQAAPKVFLLIAVLGAESGGTARLTRHLNDYFYIAHWHDADDGFPRLEEFEGDEEVEDEYDDEEDQYGLGIRRGTDSDGYDEEYAVAGETSSLASDDSVVRRRNSSSHNFSVSNSRSVRSKQSFSKNRPNHTLKHQQYQQKQRQQQQRQQQQLQLQLQQPPLFSDTEIASLAVTSRAVTIDTDVLRYKMNIISFLRMHRAVQGGGGSAPPTATQQFESLVRSLSAIHGLEYATPAMVGLAAHKIYLHRIRIVPDPRSERSMQWGSDLAAVGALLDGVGPEDVIDDVLSMVAPPV